MTNPEPSAWQSRPEAGTLLGLRVAVALANFLGRRVLHALLYPVAAYFYFVRSEERRASRRFLTRVLRRPITGRDVFRHFLNFARVTADRVYFLSQESPSIPVRFIGADAVQALVDQSERGIFLAAHMGSFEAARVIGPRLGGVRLHIVLDRQVNLRLVKTLESLNPELAGLIIDSEQSSVGLGLRIADVLRNNGWVGFLADRARPGDRTVSCEFLGDQARFPLGPFVIANTFKAPVVGIFSTFDGDQYHVHCEILSTGLRVSRQNRQQELAQFAQSYAERLAVHAMAAPYSWFNFFDFWRRS